MPKGADVSGGSRIALSRNFRRLSALVYHFYCIASHCRRFNMTVILKKI